MGGRDGDGRARQRWEGATEIGGRDGDRTARRRSDGATEMTLNSGFRLVEAATLNLGRGKFHSNFSDLGGTCVFARRKMYSNLRRL